jgi:hypothetical protein
MKTIRVLFKSGLQQQVRNGLLRAASHREHANQFNILFAIVEWMDMLQNKYFIHELKIGIQTPAGF